MDQVELSNGAEAPLTDAERARYAEQRHMFWRTRCLEHASTINAQQKLLHVLWSCLERIIDEPNNTISDGKALKEIIRLAKAGLHETRY